MVAKMRKGVPAALVPLFWIGAGNEARTRDLNLGKVALYQLSYSRKNFRRHNHRKTQPLR